VTLISKMGYIDRFYPYDAATNERWSPFLFIFSLDLGCRMFRTFANEG